MIPIELQTVFAARCPSGLEDIGAWRAYRDRMRTAMEQLDALLRSADEAELARMQAQMAALQARLTGQAPAGTVKPLVPPEIAAAASRPEVIAAFAAKRAPEIDADGIVARPSYADTDAGMGIGGGRERPMTHEQFNAELAELRDRTTAKRARNGLG